MPCLCGGVMSGKLRIFSSCHAAYVVITFVGLSLLSALPFCATQGAEYSVIASKILRPNLGYHVAVSIHNVSAPVDITVEVGGSQDSGGTVISRKTNQIDPFSTQVLKFQIGEWGPGQYNLTVTGSGGLRFTNTTALQYVQKSLSVFIQTDKAIYKPGETVRFRVVVVDPQLRPSVTGAIRLQVTDGEGNRVKQVKRAFTIKGVYTDELDLALQPVLGQWNISVEVLGQEFTKAFTVAEYVLPKFEVDIILPPYATFLERNLVATVASKYTYGKPVRGEATFAVSFLYRSAYLQPFFNEPFYKTIPIDGKASTTFDLIHELQLMDDYEREILFEVTVKEALTQRRQNASAILRLHKYPYKLQLVKTADAFKPGLPYIAYLKVAYQDDTPIQDGVNKVKIRHGFTYNSEEFQEHEYWIPSNGMIRLEFFPPNREDIHVLNIEAEYKDLKELLAAVNRAQSPGNMYIQAMLQTKSPKVNEDVEIEVNSTVNMNTFVYEVMGRGDVIFAQTIQANGEKTFRFRFNCRPSMAPTATILVYLSHPDSREIVADSLTFHVEGAFLNYVKVEVQPEETKPGKTVQLTVETNKNSLVGILGIDQSVTLLRSGNDITQSEVLEELETYNAVRKVRDFDSEFFWPGTATAADVFHGAGVVVLTNGLVYESHPWVFYRSSEVWDIALEKEDDVVSQEDLTYNEMKIKEVATLASGTSPQVAPRLRYNFPETWLWMDTDMGNDEKQTITTKAPDTITSWVITAFSLHPLFGLGITDQPSELRVFRSFFISLNLPYSVVKGESLALQAVVFNYQDKPLEAEVTLENMGKYEFLGHTNDVASIPPDSKTQKRRVTIQPRDGASVTFLIKPIEVGTMEIHITARSALAQDAVLRHLLVKTSKQGSAFLSNGYLKAEGSPQYRNKPILLDLKPGDVFKENITIDIPSYAVNGSRFIEVSAVGDVLGPAVRNLDQLIRLPFGCGEQNMLNFVPNIVVLRYLQETNQLDDEIRSKATHFLEIGYQRQLTYKRGDGSFSAFGDADSSGSTWLTAFVAKSFVQAREHIEVDESAILKALSWLSGVQDPDGGFPEVGKVSHINMQGGGGRGLALTAYVVIAYLQSRDLTRSDYNNQINRALDHLAREVGNVNEVYTLAVATYCFSLAQHPSRNTLFNRLISLAKIDGDYMYWMTSSKEPPIDAPWLHQAVSFDIEATAYMLMTYVLRGQVTQALPIMRWLVRQRNSNGGFSSTQDTVIGLEALAMLGSRLSSQSSVPVEVTFVYDEIRRKTMFVTSEKRTLLQKYELPPYVHWVEVNAKGEGVALVQVSYSYNLNVTGAYPSFELDPQLDKPTDKTHLEMSICTNYLGGGDSNMAIMDVSLPGGFTVDEDSLPSIRDYPDVRRVEARDGRTGVVIYFDKLGSSQVCPTISAFRTFPVADQRPAPVVVYDYYDHSRQARAFYKAYASSVCDICDGGSCSYLECRQVSEPGGIEDGGLDGSSTSLASCHKCLFSFPPILFILGALLS